MGHQRTDPAAAEVVRRIADHPGVPEAGTAVAAGLVAAGRQGRTGELPVKFFVSILFNPDPR